MACGIYKYEEPATAVLPGCCVYSIRSRPRGFPKDDMNYSEWNIVGWNITKESSICQITATGDTREEAIDAMRELLRLAGEYKINTYNGVPGSGLSKHPDEQKPVTTRYAISPDSFYKVEVKVGPWKKKEKFKFGKNNNCGRRAVRQQIRQIVISITYEQVEETY